jgi:hypothetical protein
MRNDIIFCAHTNPEESIGHTQYEVRALFLIFIMDGGDAYERVGQKDRCCADGLLTIRVDIRSQ